MIRVMVVAASPVVRAGLSAVVSSNPQLVPQLVVVGSTSDLDVLSRDVEQLQADVVLLDLDRNPQATWAKLQVIPEQQIILIAEEIDSIDIETALHSGVRGILPSTSTESEIIAAVSAVASGLVVLHPDFLELLSMREKVVAHPVQTLTPREIRE
jgi:two-component system, NarL family, response regulator YdfI